MKNMKQILLREKPIQIFLEIFDKYDGSKSMADIGYKNQITFSHVHEIVNKLVKAGLVSREKIGRGIELNLTTKGNKVAQKLRKFEMKLEKL